MAKPEIPTALIAAVDQFNNTPERRFDKSYEEFHKVRNRVLEKKALVNQSGSALIRSTPPVTFEIQDESYSMWLEEEDYAENGGSNDMVTLAIKLADSVSHRTARIFTWSNSSGIQIPGTDRGLPLQDYKKVDEFIGMLEYLEDSLPDVDTESGKQ